MISLPLPFLAAATLSLSALACSPNIASDTYFCGPDGLCPPGQTCNFGELPDISYSCSLSELTSPFRCSSLPTDMEPDNSPGEAGSLGQLRCDTRIEVPNFGCITTKDDVDHFLFSKTMICGGDNPNNEIRLYFPIGSAPLQLELLDPSLTPIETGEFCSSEVDIDSGQESRCISVPDLAVGDYTIRIALAPAANANCQGECEFNRYKIVLSARSR